MTQRASVPGQKQAFEYLKAIPESEKAIRE